YSPGVIALEPRSRDWAVSRCAIRTKCGTRRNISRIFLTRRSPKDMLELASHIVETSASGRRNSPLPRSSDQGGPRKRFGQPVSTKSDGATVLVTSRLYCDFARQSFCPPVEGHLALQLSSNHALHHARAEAST